MKSIEKTSSLENNDWFFLNILASKSCRGETLHSLMYQYSLPEILKLKEFVEIMEDVERAAYKDQKAESKTK
jgi:hypothetical protein